MAQPFAVFRLDYGSGVGHGHLVRCLSLARALTDEGWRVALASGEATRHVPKPIESGPWAETAVLGMGEEARALTERWPGGCDLLVVDHYGRDAEFESACRPWTRRVMVIDDLADRFHACDVLLDQTLGRRREPYDALVPKDCLCLFGTDYALMRPEFFRLRTEPRSPSREVRRILVSLGATDSKNTTALALEALTAVATHCVIDVVLSADARHLEMVRAMVATLGERAVLHIDPPNMPDIMAAADLAIGAGGTTALERCCLGVPSVVIETATNQRTVITELALAGAILTLGPRERATSEKVANAVAFLVGDRHTRMLMTSRAFAVCDGLGARRAAIALGSELLARDGECVGVRRAQDDDKDAMFSWQQDSRTRRYFRNPLAPSRDEHDAWFAERLSDPSCSMHVIFHGGRRAGVLRLDRRPDRRRSVPCFEVSILVDPDVTDRGIGRIALGIARRLVPDVDLIAEVSEQNLRSRRAFAASGYRDDGPWMVNPSKTANGASTIQ